MASWPTLTSTCFSSIEHSVFICSLVQIKLLPPLNAIGQEIVLVREHPSNEHWWEVRNEDGQTGFVPASYVMIRESSSTSLPWLSQQVLQQAEEERKERAVRLKQVRQAADGKGFGPSPRTNVLNQAVSGIKAQSTSGKENYCDVCKKQLNGPIPFKAHMASKTHREEVEALESYSNH